MLSFALTMTLGAYAEDKPASGDSATVVHIREEVETLRSIEPTYLKGALVASPWSSNWFIQAAGGANAFLGTPLGCNDLFGRMQPTGNVALGKWFTPSIGGRLDYSGVRFNDYANDNRKYQYFRADLLWNVLGNLTWDNDHSQPRWSLIPYAGVGMLHNKDNGYKPFAVSFGVQAQYHLSKRIAITGEVGDMLTMQDFDGYGQAHKFGDHMLTASLGMSISIGKTAWKRAIDARPYITQNEWLYDYAASMCDKNERLRSQHEQDCLAMEQMRKILAIEGVLDKYRHLFDNDAGSELSKGYPTNDYSGLNSLRARMKSRHKDGHPGKVVESVDCSAECGNDSTALSEHYLALLEQGDICLGAPIYFFFELGTSKLLNASQLVNLEEVARIAKKYGLSVQVVGVADRATGTTAINNNLSKSRANFIAEELTKRGLGSGNIHVESDGGIETYTPNEANRHTRIMLYYK